ncbi:unnamed protein product, partial [Amoebophrya sp. A25]
GSSKAPVLGGRDSPEPVAKWLQSASVGKKPKQGELNDKGTASATCNGNRDAGGDKGKASAPTTDKGKESGGEKEKASTIDKGKEGCGDKENASESTANKGKEERGD